MARVYSGIIEAIPDVTLTSVRRFTGEEGRYVVDESIITGHVHGAWAGMDGGGAPVEVRMLHVFEIRTGSSAMRTPGSTPPPCSARLLDTTRHLAD